MSSVSKSPWIIHYDGSSCNGCDIEVLAALTPLYDVERFGIINTGNPKHADIFLVTGGVNERNIDVVKEIYDQMVEPKVVVACGVCACTAGIFKDCYNIIGGVDQAFLWMCMRLVARFVLKRSSMRSFKALAFLRKSRRNSKKRRRKGRKRYGIE